MLRKGQVIKINIFYTKCNRQFEKSSTAEVTGYTVDKNGQIKGFEECVDCPFPVSVTVGWPPVHKRWECRAGSLPPNHTNSWGGDLDGKATVHIRSLHNDFLESVIEYCKAQPDLSAGYNQDEDDCRRSISVSCSANKKGIAAKKALIEKFFPAVEADDDHEIVKCGICGKEMERCAAILDLKHLYLCDDCQEGDDDGCCCENCNWSEDYGESVEYIKCAESGRRKDVRKRQAACANYVPADVIDNEPDGDLEEQIDELLKDGDEQQYVYRGLV